MLINLPFKNFSLSNLENSFVIRFEEDILVLFCFISQESKIKNNPNEESY